MLTATAPQELEAYTEDSPEHGLLQGAQAALDYASPESLVITLGHYAAVAHDVRTGGILRQLPAVMQVSGVGSYGGWISQQDEGCGEGWAGQDRPDRRRGRE